MRNSAYGAPRPFAGSLVGLRPRLQIVFSASARLHESQHELVRERLRIVRRYIARILLAAHERPFAIEHEAGAPDLRDDERLLDAMQRLASRDPRAGCDACAQTRPPGATASASNCEVYPPPATTSSTCMPGRTCANCSSSTGRRLSSMPRSRSVRTGSASSARYLPSRGSSRVPVAQAATRKRAGSRAFTRGRPAGPAPVDRLEAFSMRQATQRQGRLPRGRPAGSPAWRRSPATGRWRTRGW